MGLGRRGEAQGFYGFIIIHYFIHYFMQFLCSFYSGVFEFSFIPYLPPSIPPSPKPIVYLHLGTRFYRRHTPALIS